MFLILKKSSNEKVFLCPTLLNYLRPMTKCDHQQPLPGAKTCEWADQRGWDTTATLNTTNHRLSARNIQQ